MLNPWNGPFVQLTSGCPAVTQRQRRRGHHRRTRLRRALNAQQLAVGHVIMGVAFDDERPITGGGRQIKRIICALFGDFRLPTANYSPSIIPPPSMTKQIAACSCGQLTAIVTADPVRVSICHCHDCQRRTGSVFSTQARFPKAAVRVSGSSTQYARVGDEGRNAIFSFCPQCGAIVHYRIEGDDQTVAIPVGAFAESSFPVPTVSVWEEDKHPWVSLPESIEHIW